MLFLPPSDVCVRNFLYPFCTLIKLYCTKALSDQASSLAPDLILLIRKPRIPVSFHGPETTFQYHFNAESKEELKRLLMKMKEESEKAGLTLNIQRAKIMASGPIAWNTSSRSTKIQYSPLTNNSFFKRNNVFLSYQCFQRLNV